MALFWAKIQHDVEEPCDEAFGRHVCEGMAILLLRRLQLLAYVVLAVLLALDVTPLWDTTGIVGVILCSSLRGGHPTSCLMVEHFSYMTDYYVNGTCALYVSALYVLASMVLAWYARVTVASVTQVPIEVYVRKRKQREVRANGLLQRSHARSYDSNLQNPMNMKIFVSTS